MRLPILSTIGFIFIWLCCCSTDQENLVFNQEEDEMMLLEGEAVVTNVEVSGEENAYTFSVTLRSPDTGCEQYADWWEVIDLDGNLIYRRILAHSHVDEQPFTRSGGVVAISNDLEVYVRAHMNTTGYGGSAQLGSVSEGFKATNLATEFAQSLAEVNPLPDGCAF